MLTLHIFNYSYKIKSLMNSEKQGQIKVEVFDPKNAEEKACDLLRELKIFLPYEKLKLNLIEHKTLAI